MILKVTIKHSHNQFSTKLCSPEVAEELCKTASGGHSFGHDMPLLPSKSRGQKKHSENKENMEESGPHGPAGIQAQLRLARLKQKLKRMGVVFLDWLTQCITLKQACITTGRLIKLNYKPANVYSHANVSQSEDMSDVFINFHNRFFVLCCDYLV